MQTKSAVETIKSGLIHAVTRYDEKESKKKSYNPHALGIYFERVDEVISDIEAGADVRAAVVAGFSGRLADACLRQLGLAITTREEAFGSGIYKPVAKK